MASTVEIISGTAHLSVYKGFLLIRREEGEERIPFSDIDCLILASPALSLSGQVLCRLAELNVPVLHCGKNAQPVAMTLAYADNVYRKERVKMQIESSLPLKKRLWQQIVRAKIINQGSVLQLCGEKSTDFQLLAEKTQSGDTGNTEAIVARKYWERLFSKGFRRDPDILGTNSFLNYGYAIIRAAVARSIVGAGLIPDLGLQHCNMMNPYCLADDLMEPYRPFVDLCVKLLVVGPDVELNPKFKRLLVSLMDIELELEHEHASLRNCIESSVRAYVNSLIAKKAGMIYPLPDKDNKELIIKLIEGIVYERRNSERVQADVDNGDV